MWRTLTYVSVLNLNMNFIERFWFCSKLWRETCTKHLSGIFPLVACVNKVLWGDKYTVCNNMTASYRIEVQHRKHLNLEKKQTLLNRRKRNSPDYNYILHTKLSFIIKNKALFTFKLRLCHKKFCWALWKKQRYSNMRKFVTRPPCWKQTWGGQGGTLTRTTPLLHYIFT